MAETVEMRTIEVRGARPLASDLGRAESPCCRSTAPASGISTSARSTPILAEEFRGIDYDQRGYGQSEKPEQHYDIEVWADDERAGMLDLAGDRA